MRESDIHSGREQLNNIKKKSVIKNAQRKKALCTRTVMLSLFVGNIVYYIYRNNEKVTKYLAEKI